MMNNNHYGLTPRQQQVLALVVDGNSDKQIALKLGIHFSVVRIHNSNIRMKLGTSNRTASAVKAVREGLV